MLEIELRACQLDEFSNITDIKLDDMKFKDDNENNQ